MATLEEDVAAVGRLSAHAAKYGGQWLPEDHAVLSALLRRVGQEAGEAWARAVGFRAYVVLQLEGGGDVGVSLVGVALSAPKALALIAGAAWTREGCAAPCIAVAQDWGERRWSCWELLIGGMEETEQWLFAD